MSDKSRRKLLKSIAAGSGAIVAGKSLPESWSKPVVDSVMLPAHAQTSPCCVDFCNLSTDNMYVTVNNARFCNGSVTVNGGGAGPGPWGGSGPVASDGSFSFEIVTTIGQSIVEVAGIVTCSSINADWGNGTTFSGDANCT